MEAELLAIGKITRAHGIQGTLHIYIYSGSQESFSLQRFFFIKDKKDRINRYEVIYAKPHKKGLLIKCRGVSSIEEAEKLVGSSILIEKNTLSPLLEDEYYWHEIIGVKVFTESGAFLGSIEGILETGSNDVYVVRNEAKEYLIPAIAEVVTHVDIVNKVMTIHPLAGLLENDKI